MTDPRIQQLASEAAQKIKAVASQRDAEIQQIYQDFRAKVDAVQGTSDKLDTSADSQSPNHLLEDSQLCHKHRKIKIFNHSRATPRPPRATKPG